MDIIGLKQKKLEIFYKYLHKSGKEMYFSSAERKTTLDLKYIESWALVR